MAAAEQAHEGDGGSPGGKRRLFGRR